MMLDALLFAGYIHAICAALPPAVLALSSPGTAATAPQLSAAASALFTRAAHAATAVQGQHGASALLARGFAAKLPKTKAAVEQAEPKRIKGSSSWVAAWGMPASHVDRWSMGNDKRSDGAEVNAAAVQRLMQLTKDQQQS
jgi:hypothetical protein